MSTKFYHNKNGVPLKSQDDVINERGSNSIKTMTYNHHRNELLVADRLGNLYVFDYQNFHLLKKINLSNYGIDDIHLSPKGGLLGVVLVTGESFLCDCSRNYQRVQSLEPSFEDYTIKSSGLYKGIILIQDELERSNLFETISANPNKSVISDKSFKINYRKYYVKSETALKALTIHNSNTIHLQQIYKDDLTISRSVKIEYCIEGKCSGFQVHSSNDYLLALSNIGYLYIFKLINGETRLRVNIPSNPSHLTLDPSGLYCLISTCGSEETGFDKSERDFRNTQYYNKELDYVLSKPPLRERNKVVLLEIGTGSLVGEIPNVFNITSVSFSKIGDYVILGSKNGHVGVWAVRDVILDNVKDVLEQMRMNPRFWNDYPIMAQELENLEYDDESEQYSRVRTDEDSISYDELEEEESGYRSNHHPAPKNPGKRPFKIGRRKVERPKQQNYKRFKPYTTSKNSSSKPRFYEEMKKNFRDNRVEVNLKGKNDKEKRFLRDRNLEEYNPYVDTLDYKSEKSNLGRFKIDRGTLEKRHLLQRRAKIAEINKKLDVLSKSRRVEQPFVHSTKALNDDPKASDYMRKSDRMILPEPSDIDFDYDNPQNISEGGEDQASVDILGGRNNPDGYNQIDEFESKFQKQKY